METEREQERDRERQREMERERERERDRDRERERQRQVIKEQEEREERERRRMRQKEREEQEELENRMRRREKEEEEAKERVRDSSSTRAREEAARAQQEYEAARARREEIQRELYSRKDEKSSEPKPHEAEIDRQIERKQIELRGREQKALGHNPAVPIAAAAVAGAVAVAAGTMMSRSESDQGSRHEKVVEPREFRTVAPKEPYQVVEPKEIPIVAPEESYAVREARHVTIEPSQVAIDFVHGDALADPDFFKKRRKAKQAQPQSPPEPEDKARSKKEAELARRAADRVIEDLEHKYEAGPVNQADFFTPDILKDHSAPASPRIEPNADNDMTVYHDPHDAAMASRSVPPYEKPYALHVAGLSPHPWPVPTLKLIEPTPPPSRATTPVPSEPPGAAETTTAEPTPSAPAVAEPTVPEPTTAEPTTAEPTTAEPTTAEPTTAGAADERTRSTGSKVTWGKDQTHHYEVQAPEGHRDSYNADPDTRGAHYEIAVDVDDPEGPKRTTYKHENTEEPAWAASRDISPIRIPSPVRRSVSHSPVRDTEGDITDDRRVVNSDEEQEKVYESHSPHVEPVVVTPGEQEGGSLYRTPFYETVTDLGFDADEPPGTGHGAVLGEVEEEEPRTPRRSAHSAMPGGFDDEEDSPVLDRAPEPTPPREKRSKKSKFADIAASAAAGAAASTIAREIGMEDEPTRNGNRSIVEEEPPSSKKGKKKKKKGSRAFSPEATSSPSRASLPEDIDDELATSRDFSQSVADSGYVSRPSQSVADVADAPQDASFADFEEPKKKKKAKKKSKNRDDDFERSVESIGDANIDRDETRKIFEEPDSYAEERDRESSKSRKSRQEEDSEHEDHERSREAKASARFDDDKKSRRKSRDKYDYDEDRSSKRASRRDSEKYETTSVVSEPADFFETPKKSKRRSKGVDDDAASEVGSTVSLPAKPGSSSSKVKEKRSGILGNLFGKGSSQSEASKTSTRSVDDHDVDERRVKKKRSGSTKYGSDDEPDRHSHQSGERSDKKRSKDDHGLESSSRRSNGESRESKEYDRRKHRSRDDRSSSRHGDSDQESFLAERAEMGQGPLPAKQPVVTDFEQSSRSLTEDLSREIDLEDLSIIPAPSDEPDVHEEASVSPKSSSPMDSMERIPPLTLPSQERPTSWHGMQLDPFAVAAANRDEAASRSISQPPSPRLTSTDVPFERLTSSEFAENSPSSPLEYQRSQSTTAIPVRFRWQSSTPTLQRLTSVSSPVESPQSPSPTSRLRHTKTHSAEYRTNTQEVRPLYLVERTRQIPEVEDSYPELPESAETSRSPSLQDMEEFVSAVQSPEQSFADFADVAPFDEGRDLFVDTTLDDVLGSQEVTPRATTFPPGVLDLLADREVELDASQHHILTQTRDLDEGLETVSTAKQIPEATPALERASVRDLDISTLPALPVSRPSTPEQLVKKPGYYSPREIVEPISEAAPTLEAEEVQDFDISTLPALPESRPSTPEHLDKVPTGLSLGEFTGVASIGGAVGLAVHELLKDDQKGPTREITQSKLPETIGQDAGHAMPPPSAPEPKEAHPDDPTDKPIERAVIEDAGLAATIHEREASEPAFGKPALIQEEPATPVPFLLARRESKKAKKKDKKKGKKGGKSSEPTPDESVADDVAVDQHHDVEEAPTTSPAGDTIETGLEASSGVPRAAAEFAQEQEVAVPQADHRIDTRDELPAATNVDQDVVIVLEEPAKPVGESIGQVSVAEGPFAQPSVIDPETDDIVGDCGIAEIHTEHSLVADDIALAPQPVEHGVEDKDMTQDESVIEPLPGSEESKEAFPATTEEPEWTETLKSKKGKKKGKKAKGWAAFDDEETEPLAFSATESNPEQVVEGPNVDVQSEQTAPIAFVSGKKSKKVKKAKRQSTFEEALPDTSGTGGLANSPDEDETSPMPEDVPEESFEVARGPEEEPFVLPTGKKSKKEKKKSKRHSPFEEGIPVPSGADVPIAAPDAHEGAPVPEVVEMSNEPFEVEPEPEVEPFVLSTGKKSKKDKKKAKRQSTFDEELPDPGAIESRAAPTLEEDVAAAEEAGPLEVPPAVEVNKEEGTFVVPSGKKSKKDKKKAKRRPTFAEEFPDPGATEFRASTPTPEETIAAAEEIEPLEDPPPAEANMEEEAFPVPCGKKSKKDKQKAKRQFTFDEEHLDDGTRDIPATVPGLEEEIKAEIPEEPLAVELREQEPSEAPLAAEEINKEVPSVTSSGKKSKKDKKKAKRQSVLDEVESDAAANESPGAFPTLNEEIEAEILPESFVVEPEQEEPFLVPSGKRSKKDKKKAKRQSVLEEPTESIEQEVHIDAPIPGFPLAEREPSIQVADDPLTLTPDKVKPQTTFDEGTTESIDRDVPVHIPSVDLPLADHEPPSSQPQDDSAQPQEDPFLWTSNKEATFDKELTESIERDVPIDTPSVDLLAPEDEPSEPRAIDEPEEDPFTFTSSKKSKKDKKKAKRQSVFNEVPEESNEREISVNSSSAELPPAEVEPPQQEEVEGIVEPDEDPFTFTSSKKSKKDKKKAKRQSVFNEVPEESNEREISVNSSSAELPPAEVEPPQQEVEGIVEPDEDPFTFTSSKKSKKDKKKTKGQSIFENTVDSCTEDTPIEVTDSGPEPVSAQELAPLLPTGKKSKKDKKKSKAWTAFEETPEAPSGDVSASAAEQTLAVQPIDDAEDPFVPASTGKKSKKDKKKRAAWTAWEDTEPGQVEPVGDVAAPSETALEDAPLAGTPIEESPKLDVPANTESQREVPVEQDSENQIRAEEPVATTPDEPETFEPVRKGKKKKREIRKSKAKFQDEPFMSNPDVEEQVTQPTDTAKTLEEHESDSVTLPEWNISPPVAELDDGHVRKIPLPPVTEDENLEDGVEPDDQPISDDIDGPFESPHDKLSRDLEPMQDLADISQILNKPESAQAEQHQPTYLPEFSDMDCDLLGTSEVVTDPHAATEDIEATQHQVQSPVEATIVPGHLQDVHEPQAEHPATRLEETNDVSIDAATVPLLTVEDGGLDKPIETEHAPAETVPAEEFNVVQDQDIAEAVEEKGVEAELEPAVAWTAKKDKKSKKKKKGAKAAEPEPKEPVTLADRDMTTDQGVETLEAPGLLVSDEARPSPAEESTSLSEPTETILPETANMPIEQPVEADGSEWTQPIKKSKKDKKKKRKGLVIEEDQPAGAKTTLQPQLGISTQADVSAIEVKEPEGGMAISDATADDSAPIEATEPPLLDSQLTAAAEATVPGPVVGAEQEVMDSVTLDTEAPADVDEEWRVPSKKSKKDKKNKRKNIGIESEAPIQTKNIPQSEEGPTQVGTSGTQEEPPLETPPGSDMIEPVLLVEDAKTATNPLDSTFAAEPPAPKSMAVVEAESGDLPTPIPETQAEAVEEEWAVPSKKSKKDKKKRKGQQAVAEESLEQSSTSTPVVSSAPDPDFTPALTKAEKKNKKNKKKTAGLASYFDGPEVPTPPAKDEIVDTNVVPMVEELAAVDQHGSSEHLTAEVSTDAKNEEPASSVPDRSIATTKPTPEEEAVDDFATPHEQPKALRTEEPINPASDRSVEIPRLTLVEESAVEEMPEDFATPLDQVDAPEEFFPVTKGEKKGKKSKKQPFLFEDVGESAVAEPSSVSEPVEQPFTVTSSKKGKKKGKKAKSTTPSDLATPRDASPERDTMEVPEGAQALKSTDVEIKDSSMETQDRATPDNQAAEMAEFVDDGPNTDLVSSLEVSEPQYDRDDLERGTRPEEISQPPDLPITEFNDDAPSSIPSVAESLFGQPTSMERSSYFPELPQESSTAYHVPQTAERDVDFAAAATAGLVSAGFSATLAESAFNDDDVHQSGPRKAGSERGVLEDHISSKATTTPGPSPALKAESNTFSPEAVLDDPVFSRSHSPQEALDTTDDLPPILQRPRKKRSSGSRSPPGSPPPSAVERAVTEDAPPAEALAEAAISDLEEEFPVTKTKKKKGKKGKKAKQASMAAETNTTQEAAAIEPEDRAVLADNSVGDLHDPSTSQKYELENPVEVSNQELEKTTATTHDPPSTPRDIESSSTPTGRRIKPMRKPSTKGKKGKRGSTLPWEEQEERSGTRGEISGALGAGLGIASATALKGMARKSQDSSTQDQENEELGEHGIETRDFAAAIDSPQRQSPSAAGARQTSVVSSVSPNLERVKRKAAANTAEPPSKAHHIWDIRDYVQEPTWASPQEHRDSAVHIGGSPQTKSLPLMPDTTRDSGYHDTPILLPPEHHAPRSVDTHESTPPLSSNMPSSKEQLQGSDEVGSDWEVSAHPTLVDELQRDMVPPRSRPVSLAEGTAPPSTFTSPMDATTKARTSYLFSSSPSIRDTPIRRPRTPDESRQAIPDEDLTPSIAGRTPTSPSDTGALSMAPRGSGDQSSPSPFGTGSSMRSLGRDSTMTPSRNLATIEEQGSEPGSSPLSHKAQRTSPPEASLHHRFRSLSPPEHASPDHEHRDSAGLDHVLAQSPRSPHTLDLPADSARSLGSPSLQSPRDLRSPPPSSERSIAVNRLRSPLHSGTRTPDSAGQRRPLSAMSAHSHHSHGSNQSLRRTDRSLSGDLRIASRLSETQEPGATRGSTPAPIHSAPLSLLGIAAQDQDSPRNISPPGFGEAGPSDYDKFSEVSDKGKNRAVANAMGDVFVSIALSYHHNASIFGYARG
ncbi:hypothetical protein P152DRAFT_108596 [Eremomyces bilateralis CBS 781.70]|uniref:Uncharacterized protein n=1 Tax=Eremomyces bilateralis CBS 781.70 TaxID=1392243 RepID=A0A6G1GDU3_9PEZI|nr:uncharacterized protein P152DRAFT_108596 [Eremomyces bilateralis CBS 781.70]KAF1816029.1 hypothetical protein P152DRAFT_108596 [Eremomyces bilateralis CBS 781.70]